MATFISTLPITGSGPRLAVKDLIDVADSVTTAGSRAVAEFAQPATADAPLLQGFTDAGWRIVGKTNLHELAFGTSGVNEWAGTPTNPLDARRIPGGSSSGSAVAVANDDADVALGSDTGGSIRIPAAFCGVTGLKTTFGRIPLQGVWPLAKSLDTVGPMARDVQGLLTGMEQLERGFRAAADPATVIGRLRLPSEIIDPTIEDAVDDALRSSGLEIEEIELPEWGEAWTQCTNLLVGEAWDADRRLVEDPVRAAMLGEAVRDRLISGSQITAAQRVEALQYQQRFIARLGRLFDRAQLLALPTAGMFPPLIADDAPTVYNRLTSPINFAGLPALALPVASRAALPASLQLVGPANAEDLLLATGLFLEGALRS